MLATRIRTAIVMLFVLLVVLLAAGPSVFSLALALFAAAAGWEWGRLRGIDSDRDEVRYSVTVGLVALIGLTVLDAGPIVHGILFLACVFWLIVPWRLAAQPSLPPATTPDWQGLLFGIFLILAAVLAMRFLRDTANGASNGLLLYALAVVWVMDVGAYFAGRRFGQRKLAPAISPGKTWEGVYGGLAALLVLLLLVLLLSDWADGRALALTIATLAAGALSVYGDLYESRLKRAAGMKDSSQLLPGHGGVLDRIDAQLPALPVFAWLWSVL